MKNQIFIFAMPFLSQYPQLKIIQPLARRKKTAVYLVGGFVRDQMILPKTERPDLDFDFALEKDAMSFARIFSRRIKGAFVLLDKEHGCARVVKKTKQGMETYDFADFRAKTFAEDLRHRDFTINTLSVAIHNLNERAELPDEVRDPLHGLRDIEARRIRMTTAQVFREDPLRLLRAFSLSAGLDFSIDRATLAQIKKDRSLIRDVSAERVRDEIFKILDSPAAAATLKAMDRVGLLEEVIPQIRVMFDVHQGTYHHLDVWPHSLAAVEELEKLLAQLNNDEDIRLFMDEVVAGARRRRALVKLAALVHDIGKPVTRKREADRISFHGHERAGRDIGRAVALALKLSTRERFLLEDMVLWHLRPGYLSNFKVPSERAVFRYFRDTKTEAVSIALLSWADQRATRGPLTTEEDQAHHEKICRGLISGYFRRQKEKPIKRLITGDDLIKKLKLKPGPVFAKILQAVEEQQALGKITTKKEALARAKQMTREMPELKARSGRLKKGAVVKCTHRVMARSERSERRSHLVELPKIARLPCLAARLPARQASPPWVARNDTNAISQQRQKRRRGLARACGVLIGIFIGMNFFVPMVSWAGMVKKMPDLYLPPRNATGTPKRQYSRPNTTSMNGAPKVRISGGKSSISLIRMGNSLFVDVKLNRRETARFLLDTGCSETQISKRLARRLGLNPEKGKEIPAQLAGGRTVQARVVMITELRVGQARVSPVRAVVLEEEGPSHYDGLLGMSFLNHFIFRIDAERGKLNLQKRYKDTL